MRDYAGVARKQLRTSNYSQEARTRLGEAVEAARTAAGYRYRTEFCRAHNIKSLRSLELLEQGKTGVGQAFLFEVADALPGWARETPQVVLDGGPIPPLHDESSTRDEPAPEAAGGTMPEPQDYPGELEYMEAVYWYLRRMNMSHEAVMRGFGMAAAIYSRKVAERNGADTDGDMVG